MHWQLAAFVGVSKPLGRLSAGVLLGGYTALCVATVSIACPPLVRRHVLRWRRSSDPALRIDHVIGRYAYRFIVGTPKALLVPLIAFMTVIGSFAIHSEWW